MIVFVDDDGRDAVQVRGFEAVVYPTLCQPVHCYYLVVDGLRERE